MADARELIDDATHHLDRLGAVILDDVGDGPAPSEFSAHAAAANEAVARIGLAAFSELTGLIVGVGDSLVAGTADWSPSLGGTLMAAVDDLRTLIGRADQFSHEDGEHLHHRASDLAVYVRAPRGGPVSPPSPAPTPMTAEASSDSPTAVSAKPINRPTDEPAVVPIANLFFAEGPQVVSGGVPKSATSASELLGAGIDALDGLTIKPIAPPLESATVVVPVDNLIYRGRPALERAAEIQKRIRTSGAVASPAALDEMYDLIDLALKD